jgi:hypothetical protein
MKPKETDFTKGNGELSWPFGFSVTQFAVKSFWSPRERDGNHRAVV